MFNCTTSRPFSVILVLCSRSIRLHVILGFSGRLSCHYNIDSASIRTDPLFERIFKNLVETKRQTVAHFSSYNADFQAGDSPDFKNVKNVNAHFRIISNFM